MQNIHWKQKMGRKTHCTGKKITLQCQLIKLTQQVRYYKFTGGKSVQRHELQKE